MRPSCLRAGGGLCRHATRGHTYPKGAEQGTWKATSDTYPLGAVQRTRRARTDSYHLPLSIAETPLLGSCCVPRGRKRGSKGLIGTFFFRVFEPSGRCPDQKAFRQRVPKRRAVVDMCGRIHRVPRGDTLVITSRETLI